MSAGAELIAAAARVRDHAYAPYSGFRVGAAVRGASGKVYLGVNVENASYGLTQCAERAAITAAVTAGETCITELALVLPLERPASPCGACRQVIRELGAHARIWLATSGGAVKETTIAELLPDSFGPEHLEKR